jgi:hypothetical protein
MPENELSWSFLSIFQTLGALGGFASAAVLLGDRLLRHRPYMVQKAEAASPLPTKRLCAEVHNPGPYPIIIRTVANWDELQAALDDGTKSGIAAYMGIESSAAVEGRSSRTFPVFMPGNFDELPKGHALKLTLSWRYAQVRPGIRRSRLLCETATKEALQTIVSSRRHFADGDQPIFD